MTRMLTFTVTHKFPSLNEAIAEAKKHWSLYARMKRANTNLVADYIRSLRRAGNFPLEVFDKASVYMIFEERAKGKLRDWDNITFAKKFILDGMVEACIIPDDSPKHIVSLTERVFYGDEYSVMVRIEV